MASVAPYIPAKDSLFDPWVGNFASLIVADPLAFGLTAGDAGNIQAARVAWGNAYALMTSPGTKTAAAVAAKDAAKVNCLAVVRPYAQMVSLNPGVSAENKVAVGVNPRTSVPSPVTAPSAAPELSVVAALVGQLVLRYRDAVASPKVKAKPYGVVQCAIYGEVSATPITDPSFLPQIAVATKCPFTLDTSAFPAGSRLYLSSAWVTRTGLYSPRSAVLSTIVLS